VRVPSTAATFAALFLLVACATNQPKARTSSVRSTAGAGCLDTLHATDSISAIVKMSVTPQDTAAKLPPDFEGMFAEEFRSHFKVPSRLALSVVLGSPPCDSLGSRCAGASLNVGAIAYATANNEGKLSDIQVIDAALTPSLADSVASALRAMSKAGTAPATGDRESIALVMRLTPEDDPDTVPPERRIFKAKVPHYDIPFTYATMPAAGVDARFPFNARLAGVGDSVTIAFTVDSDGMIVPESLELVRATYRDFVASVLGALTKTRYHPAYLGDCAVATRMTQRFLFRMPD
jgi:Gram-negative bacterial TonB protein C-terminal